MLLNTAHLGLRFRWTRKKSNIQVHYAMCFQSFALHLLANISLKYLHQIRPPKRSLMSKVLFNRFRILVVSHFTFF
jgi:hypothetical protein